MKLRVDLVVLLWVIGVYLGFGAHDCAFAKGKGGSVSVKGYVRKDGTYVAPHHRSAPDGNLHNNWSTKGNINPYTGKEGTKTAPVNGYGSSKENVESQAPVPSEPSGLNDKLIHDVNSSKQGQTPVGHGVNCPDGYYGQGADCFPH